MIEIFVDLDDFESENEKKKATENIKKLCKSGWSKFGSGVATLLFKETTIEEAEEELNKLKIKNMKLEENDYSID